MSKEYELGTILKDCREAAKESIEEVSGAVEVSTMELQRYENGRALPSEEVLGMLIAHFNLEDDQAIELWDLAGYDAPVTAQMVEDQVLEEGLASKAAAFYTDTIQVMVNDQGVVLSFIQANPDGDQNVVARLGMSKEHAKHVLKALEASLEEPAESDPS